MARDADGTGVTGSGSNNEMSAEALGRFGLEMNPFTARHNPKFLLRSSPLRRVLKALRESMDTGTKLLVVVGEPGVGKTAAIDAMSREFKDGVRTACISDPSASWSEIGQEIGEKLRLTGGRLSPGAMSADEGAVRVYRVIVDRAELLRDDSVKHLGAYLDLKAGDGRQVHKLQVVMMARDVKDAPLFRWLSGRAHAQLKLGPLQAEQVRHYVDRRVKISQGVASPVFSSDALDRIAEGAGGNPKAINRLCSAALKVAASRGTSVVDAETIGTAARRLAGGSPPAEAVAPPVAVTAAPVMVPPIELTTPVDSFDALLDAPSVATRVEVLQTETPNRSQAVWATVCAALVGIIAGGVGFLYFNQPPPVIPPAVQIVEVEVERIVEVPVEVVKIVRVEVPVKPKPRAPKPRKVAKVVPPPAKPAPRPVIAAKKPEPGPILTAATVLDRAFARKRPGNHTRMVEILEHGDEGAKLTQTLKLARLERKTRTLTLGVLTGDVSSNAREIESRFLSIETGRLEDERFGYRPAKGKLEPLKGGRGRDPFYGSSFQFDDFRVHKASQYVIHSMERNRIDDQYFYAVSAKPRYRADYERVDFVIDARDYALVETHYFKGLGLRPYRVVQYPKGDMKVFGNALVPMRTISRDFQTNRIDEARVVKFTLEKALDPKLFTLNRIQEPVLELPHL